MAAGYAPHGFSSIQGRRSYVNVEIEFKRYTCNHIDWFFNFGFQNRKEREDLLNENLKSQTVGRRTKGEVSQKNSHPLLSSSSLLVSSVTFFFGATASAYDVSADHFLDPFPSSFIPYPLFWFSFMV